MSEMGMFWVKRKLFASRCCNPVTENEIVSVQSIKSGTLPVKLKFVTIDTIFTIDRIVQLEILQEIKCNRALTHPEYLQRKLMNITQSQSI